MVECQHLLSYSFLKSFFFFFFSSDGSATVFLFMWGLVLDDSQDAAECENDGGAEQVLKNTTKPFVGWEETERSTLDDTPQYPTASSWCASSAAFPLASDSSARANRLTAAPAVTPWRDAVGERSVWHAPHRGAPPVTHFHAHTRLPSCPLLPLHGQAEAHGGEKRTASHTRRAPTAPPPPSCAAVSSTRTPVLASSTRALTRSEVAALLTFRAWKEEEQKQKRSAVSPETRGGNSHHERTRADASTRFLFSPLFSPSSVYSPASLLLQCVMEVCRAPAFGPSARRGRENGGRDEWEASEESDRHPKGDDGLSSFASFSIAHGASLREKQIEANATRVGRWLVHHLPLLLLAARRAGEDSECVGKGNEWKRWKQACDQACETPPDRSPRSPSAAIFLPLLLEIVVFYVRMGVLEDLPEPLCGVARRRKSRRVDCSMDEEERESKRRGKWRTHEGVGGRTGYYTTPREEEADGVEEEADRAERKRERAREGEIPHWLCVVFLCVLNELGVFSPVCGSIGSFSPSDGDANGTTFCSSDTTALPFRHAYAFPPPLPSPHSCSALCQEGWYWLVMQEWVAAILSLSLRRHSGAVDPHTRRSPSCETPSSILARGLPSTTGNAGSRRKTTSGYDACASFAAPLSQRVEKESTDVSFSPLEQKASRHVAWVFFPFLCVAYLVTQGGLTASPSPSSSTAPSDDHSDTVSRPYLSYQQEKIVQKRMQWREKELTSRLLSPSSSMHTTAVLHCRPVDTFSPRCPTAEPRSSATSIRAAVPSAAPSTLLWCASQRKKFLWTPQEAMLSLCALLVSHPRYPCLASLVPTSGKFVSPYSPGWTKENHPSASSTFSFSPSSLAEEVTQRKGNLSLQSCEDCSTSTESIPSWLLFYQQRMAELWREWNAKFLLGLPQLLPLIGRTTIRSSFSHHDGADHPLFCDPFFAATGQENAEGPHKWLLLNHILTSL